MAFDPPAFAVLLHGPGLPEAGVTTHGMFRAGRLVITHAQSSPAWSELALRIGGFDGRQWQIAWSAPEGAYSALLADAEAVAVFGQSAPPELGALLNMARNQAGRGRRRFQFLVAVVALAFLIPVALAALFWLNADRLSQWAADRISPELERSLGDLAYARMQPGLKLIEQGPAPEAMARLVARLASGGAGRYQVFVARDEQVNAFALPGGRIVVFTGLLKAAESAEEVAGVLAHEMAHVQRRHSLRALVHNLGWRAVLAAAAGDLGAGIWGDAAAHLGGLSYSRDLEREADLAALDLLRRADLPAQGLERFLARLAAKEGGPGRLVGMELLATHPAGEERLQALRQALAGQAREGDSNLATDWAHVVGSLN